MIPAKVQQLFDAFESEDRDLYLVGGAVRDYLLGTDLDDLDDLDFCTDARPKTSRQILNKHGFQTYDLGFEFGTVGTILRDSDSDSFPKDCQITTYRSDEYYRRGSRHPSVEFGDTLQQDLSRRDFSINSIAMDGNATFIDPHGGRRDLEQGILRVIGDPRETLAEDPLRIMRTGRFISRLGFEPTDVLKEAAHAKAHCILEISRERWYEEMTKLLVGTYLEEAFDFLHRSRLLGIILPEIEALVRSEPPASDAANLWTSTIQLLGDLPAKPKFRWGGLLLNIGKIWTRLEAEGDVSYPGHRAQARMLFSELSTRFRFDNETKKFVKAALRHADTLPEISTEALTDPDVRRFVTNRDPYPDELLTFEEALAGLEPRKRAESKKQLIDEIRARMRKLKHRETLRPSLPSGLGNSIMDALDLEPSPVIGQLKNLLTDKIIAGDLEDNRAAPYYVDYLKQRNLDAFFESEDP